MKLPKTTKSAILPAYNPNLIRALVSIKIAEREIPKLQPEEVLIKMAAAPCNPSDIAFLQGRYNVVKSLPAIPGFEGAGTIINAGKKKKNMIGKRVSFFTQADGDGTWSEYIVASASDCLILNDNLSFEQAACLAINPLTAYALFELAMIKYSKAIIQNAAGGQVAAFLRLLAKKQNIAVINIVRKKEHIEKLKTNGADYVLDSSDKSFAEDLKMLAKELNARIAFDAVGGEQCGTILNALPDGGEVILYGGLSGADVSGIDSLELIFKKKKLYGFNLNEWLELKGHSEVQNISSLIQELIVEEEFQTKIQATFKLDDLVKGIRTYIKSMSDGKVLIVP
jgi:NADPH:quinone reductase-like Zn-dependent oxidoreductase